MSADLSRNETLLVDVVEAATLLGMTPKAIRQRVARRLLPFRRLGSRIVFLRSELVQFLAACPGCSVEEARVNADTRNGAAR